MLMDKIVLIISVCYVTRNLLFNDIRYDNLDTNELRIIFLNFEIHISYLHEYHEKLLM